MTSRVLIVNHGPKVVVLELYNKRTGPMGCFVPDPLVSETPVTPGTELAVYVTATQYVKVVELE